MSQIVLDNPTEDGQPASPGGHESGGSVAAPEAHICAAHNEKSGGNPDSSSPGAPLPMPDISADYEPLAEDEAHLIRKNARLMGASDFIQRYVFEQRHNLLRLVHAFRDQFSSSEWNDVIEDILPRREMAQIYACVHIGVQRFIKRRKRLHHIHSLDHVLDLLQSSRKIMLVTGAGISVSCGIPDFRSKDGIYSRLNDYELQDPTQMFDLAYFKHKPETFYSFAKEIYPSNFSPSPCHKFVALLESKGKLLRSYTQNIDNIEELAGVERVIQCHGSFKRAKCVTCGYTVPGREIEKEVFAMEVPKCPQCLPDSPFPVMKPEIVFFGEQLPQEFHNSIKLDVLETDLVIVIGSSLKVAPVSEILRIIPDHVPQIIINRELLPHMEHHFDVHLLGPADTIVAELCRRLGWQLDHPNAQLSEPLPFEFYEPNKYLFEGGVLQGDNWSDSDSSSVISAHGSSDEDDDDEQGELQDEDCVKTLDETADPQAASTHSGSELTSLASNQPSVAPSQDVNSDFLSKEQADDHDGSSEDQDDDGHESDFDELDGISMDELLGLQEDLEDDLELYKRAIESNPEDASPRKRRRRE